MWMGRNTDVIFPDCRRFMISIFRNHLLSCVLCLFPLYSEYISSAKSAKKSLHKSIDPQAPRDLIHRLGCYITKTSLFNSHLCSFEISVKIAMLVCGHSSSCKVSCDPSLAAMDSCGSSSDSGLPVEERLDALETALGRLRAQTDR